MLIAKAGDCAAAEPWRLSAAYKPAHRQHYASLTGPACVLLRTGCWLVRHAATLYGPQRSGVPTILRLADDRACSMPAHDLKVEWLLQANQLVREPALWMRYFSVASILFLPRVRFTRQFAPEKGVPSPVTAGKQRLYQYAAGDLFIFNTGVKEFTPSTGFYTCVLNCRVKCANESGSRTSSVAAWRDSTLQFRQDACEKGNWKCCKPKPKDHFGTTVADGRGWRRNARMRRIAGTTFSVYLPRLSVYRKVEHPLPCTANRLFNAGAMAITISSRNSCSIDHV